MYYLNNKKPILLTLLLVLSSCSFNSNEKTTNNTDSVNTLDLKHINPKGELKWIIESKNTVYDVKSGLLEAFEPEAVIYKDNNPNYKLISRRLFGSTNRTYNFKDNVSILFINNDIKISSEEIIWDTKNTTIRSISPTTFTKFQANSKSKQYDFSVTTDNSIWNTNNGNIYSTGNVKGIGGIAESNYTISGFDMVGNTISGYLKLLDCKLNQSTSKIESQTCWISFPTNNREANKYIFYFKNQDKQIISNIVINN